MDSLDIIKQFLTDNEYDGLVDEYAECGCQKDDLAPCSDYFGGCLPAYEHPGKDHHDFIMSTKKPPKG